jgi:hypothetical protein
MLESKTFRVWLGATLLLCASQREISVTLDRMARCAG